jgi:hypothetical protein
MPFAAPPPEPPIEQEDVREIDHTNNTDEQRIAEIETTKEILTYPKGTKFPAIDACAIEIAFLKPLSVGAKAKTLPFAPAFVYLAMRAEAKRPARTTLRPPRYKTKAYNDVAPSHALTRLGGPREIRPMLIGPARRSVLRARFVMTLL